MCCKNVSRWTHRLPLTCVGTTERSVQLNKKKSCFPVLHIIQKQFICKLEIITVLEKL